MTERTEPPRGPSQPAIDERDLPHEVSVERTVRVVHHALRDPQFYVTSPSPCPYLKGRSERKVFTHLAGTRAGTLNDVLTRTGFRRSQNIAYRPACETCQACVSVRVEVDAFRPSRSQRRILARNADVVGEPVEGIATPEQYDLFRAYVDARHGGGGMADMTVLDYAMMIEDTQVTTQLIEFRERRRLEDGPERGRLLGVTLADRLADGLSLVYSFFDPAEARRSLGTHMILDHVDRARALGLPFVYLGYWVPGSSKMDYKGRFLPQQFLDTDGWKRRDVDGSVDGSF